MSESENTLLTVKNIAKSFGATKALKNVSVSLAAGSVHAIIGENGAGKSTLMKILAGAEQPNGGAMLLEGANYYPANPAAGRLAGVAMIYQELTLAPHLSVEANITLGIEKQLIGGIIISQKQAVKDALALLGLSDLNPDTLIQDISIARQQLVEIARALLLNAKVVILDEPTSSLSAEDTIALFKVITLLKNRGIGVLYISHFLEEVQQVADTYTVIRDGESVGNGMMAGTTIPDLIQLMVGRPLADLYPRLPHTMGAAVLEVRNLHATVDGVMVAADFDLAAGEIMGISGLIGSGRTELLRAIFGLAPAISGKVTLDSKVAEGGHFRSVKAALKAGLDMLSENRKEEGLALSQPILSNITLSKLGIYRNAFGGLDLEAEATAGNALATKLAVKCHSTGQQVGALSGGNQQKVCLARLLHYDNKVLILDEPTRGIDVGSKAEIYRLIQQLAVSGKSIIMVSSYLPELLGTCDTLAVMYKGKLSKKLPVDSWTDQSIMQYSTSGTLDSLDEVNA